MSAHLVTRRVSRRRQPQPAPRRSYDSDVVPLICLDTPTAAAVAPSLIVRVCGGGLAELRTDLYGDPTIASLMLPARS